MAVIVKAKVRKTGERLELKSYGFGYLSVDGRFFHRTQVSIVEKIPHSKGTKEKE